MNPWCSPDIAQQMRANVDRQLAEVPWPVHFTAYADAAWTASYISVLEVGCGVGHGYEILERRDDDRDARRFTGLDISEHAIALARERYPDAHWEVGTVDVLPAFGVTYDVVIDGSCVLHVEAWREHLAALCAASRDAVILHRIPMQSEMYKDLPSDARPYGPNVSAERDRCAKTEPITTSGYGCTFQAWRFAVGEVRTEMSRHGFRHTETRKADGDSLTLTFRKAV